MEINQENSETEKEKKKKRPTLTYYQPPRTRQTSSKVNQPTNENIEKEEKSKKVSDPLLNEENKTSKKSYRNNRIAKDDEKIVEAKSAVNSENQESKIENIKEPSQSIPFKQKKNEVPFETVLVENKKSLFDPYKEKQIMNNSAQNRITPKKIPNENLSEQEKIKSSQESNDSVRKIQNTKLFDLYKDEKSDVEGQINSSKQLFNPYNPSKPLIYVQKPQQYQTNKKDSSYQGSYQQPHSPNIINNKNAINEAKIKTVVELIQALESRLKCLVENCDYTNFKESSEHINDLRKELERLCLQAILTHIETSTKLNIDLNFWRICYHQIIENLRKEYNYALNTLNDASRSAQLKNFCDSYINEGFDFYENFIKKIEETYNFDKSLYLDLNKVRPTNSTSKSIKLALLCTNRCFICLGDLSRYKELFNEIKDYSAARSYYLKAMYLAPKCSRAYNQLAILALYTRRRLDSVYYYMRCLELNQPLLTARQSLISLFDEARKRSEIISEKLNKKKPKPSAVSSNSSNRVEVWIRPTATTTTTVVEQKIIKSNSDDEDSYYKVIDDDNDSNELLNLSSNELNKRFMHDYLNLIGKLFTKVGMESYSEVCSRMLYEFRELLKRDNCPIGKMRLLQITIINISIVSLTKTINNNNNNNRQYKSYKNENSDDDDAASKTVKQSDNNENIILQRSQLQEFGVQLCLDMFSIIVKRLTHLLSTSSIDITGLMENKIRELHPSVKILSDWMKQNVPIWLPLPDQLPPDLGPNPDIFQSISNLFNEIGKIDRTCVSFFNCQNEDENLTPIVLGEDRETAGFLPLDSCNKEIIYAQVEDLNDLETFKDFQRLNKMCQFADFLCNLKKQQVIKYDIMNRVYVPIKNRIRSEKDEEEENKNDSTAEKESIDIDLDQNLRELNLNQSVDEDMNDLIEKRKNLKAKVDEKLKRDQNLQTFVESTASRRIELEIRPRFLVSDTNCFVDHLDLIESLLKSTRFIIVVPLLVINELDKLAKSISNYNDDSIEHAEYVQRNAKKSIAFLNEKFENRERNIKAMTSQGSVLETIQFRSEEVKPHAGTNDDLILGCCLYYCKDNPRDYMPKDKNDSIHLFREVILLTEDRNLRLKAHTRNVPVKNIINFCKWANISKVAKGQSEKMVNKKFLKKEK